MKANRSSIFGWTGLVSSLALLLSMLPLGSPALGEAAGVDSVGRIIGGPVAADPGVIHASGPRTTSPVSILLFKPLDGSGITTRLRLLGYAVTESFDANNDLIRANLQNYDVLWMDVSVTVEWNPTRRAEIQTWVNEDGGGVVVVQPDEVGQHTLFPAGFEVYVSNRAWPGFPAGGYSTMYNPNHPITQGLGVSDLPGNGDWVWWEDIGPSWDVLAVDATMPDEVVSLLAGQYGQGRFVYTNGYFGNGSVDPASNQFVIQMLNWLAQYEPPPPWGAAATAQASTYGAKTSQRSALANGLGLFFIPAVAVIVLRVVRRRKR